jgi:hypothetical protein
MKYVMIGFLVAVWPWPTAMLLTLDCTAPHTPSGFVAHDLGGLTGYQ